MWSSTTQEVWVIELTVCFETSYDVAHNRKTARYADLIQQIGQSPFNVHFLTVEVGSCGFISLPSFRTIKQQLLQCSGKQWEDFLMEVTRATIEGSHKIWATRNWTGRLQSVDWTHWTGMVDWNSLRVH